MAHYHLEIKTGAKGRGSAHASYIEREGKFSNRQDLEFTKSGNMPSFAQDNHNEFWKAADKYERANGRSYTEIEFSLPRELSKEHRQKLADEYVKNIIGENHAYTYAIHKPNDRYGNEQPHVHFMFSERTNDGIERTAEQYFKRYNPENPEKGGAKKDRYFSNKVFVTQSRKEWTRTANHFLEKHGYGVRIDDRSYVDRGIDLTSQHQYNQHLKSEILIKNYSFKTSEQIKDIQRENGNKIIADPTIALKVLTSNESTFTKRDLENFIFAHTDGSEQYTKAFNEVLNHEQFKKLAGVEKYTTQEMYDIEKNIVDRVENTNATQFKTMKLSDIQINEKVSAKRTFNTEQNEAFKLLTTDRQISCVNGAAGTGKSYVLNAVNEAYQERGYHVHGVALQGLTSQNMKLDCGIESNTIASFLIQHKNGKITLNNKSVIILDEAGMVGSRDMQKLLEITQNSNAQIKMVGDSYQLNAVSAGNSFKTIQDHLQDNHQSSLKQIMRQRNESHREASIDLSKHDINHAIDKYEKLGNITKHETQDMARLQTAKNWFESEADSKAMLAYSNKDVNALNDYARSFLKDNGTLGPQDFNIATMHGKNAFSHRNFAVNEQIIFKENNKKLNVLNGSKATIQDIKADTNGEVYAIHAQLENGNKVEFSPNEYNQFTHGYATTIHGSQGMTVKESHVLLSSNMNANLAYVSMTRHKDDIVINYSKEEFKNGIDSVKQELGKSDNKEFSADYTIDESFNDIKEQFNIEKRETFADKSQAINESKTDALKQDQQTDKFVTEHSQQQPVQQQLAQQENRPMSVQDRLDQMEQMEKAKAQQVDKSPEQPQPQETSAQFEQQQPAQQENRPMSVQDRLDQMEQMEKAKAQQADKSPEQLQPIQQEKEQEMEI